MSVLRAFHIVLFSLFSVCLSNESTREQLNAGRIEHVGVAMTAAGVIRDLTAGCGAENQYDYLSEKVEAITALKQQLFDLRRETRAIGELDLVSSIRDNILALDRIMRLITGIRRRQQNFSASQNKMADKLQEMADNFPEINPDTTNRPPRPPATAPAACTAANCNKCDNQGRCSSCAPGFALDSHRCVECATAFPNCNTCAGNVCESCNSGFVATAAGCRRCSAVIPNCATCGENGRCSACADGYALQTEGHCVACSSAIPNCNTCGQDNRCSSCAAGYVINDQGQCAGCSSVIPNCNSCSSDGRCTSCTSGMAVNAQGQCASCSSVYLNCDTCGPNGGCATCQDGYTVNSQGQCESCATAIPHCIQCGDNGVCDMCEEGYNFHEGQCTYCASVVPLCTRCVGPNICVDCEAGYITVSMGSNIQCLREVPQVPPGATVQGPEVIDRAISADGNVGMRIANPSDYFPSAGTITEFRYYSTGASDERIAFYATRVIKLYRYQAIGITWHTPTHAGVHVVPANIPVWAYDGIGYFHTSPNVIPYDVVPCVRGEQTATRTAWAVPGDVRDDTGYILMPEDRCVTASLQAVFTPN